MNAIASVTSAKSSIKAIKNVKKIVSKAKKSSKIKIKDDFIGNSITNPKNTEQFVSKRAAFREAKRDAGIPTSQTHKTHQDNLKADALDTKRSATEFDFGEGRRVQDHPNGHKFKDGGTYDKPHLNNHGNGGENKHYEY